MRARFAASIASVIILLAASIGSAGGPYVHNGAAARWQDDTMKWCIDKGSLAAGVTSATAQQWIKDLLALWSNVKLTTATNAQVATTVFKSQFVKTVDVDLTEANFVDFDDPECPVIIALDETGAIIELFGEGRSDDYLGVSAPSVVDEATNTIKGGWIVFNGKMLANTLLGATAEERQKSYQASVLHELGHVLGLDHAQVNYSTLKSCSLASCSSPNSAPTMYPKLISSLQATPHYDDRITISWIYPSSNLASEFCTVTGEVFDGAGRPLKGVNVIATNTSNSVDTRNFVSGVLHNECEGDSRYYLHGLKPNVSYKITYEPLAAEFTGASGFEPLDSPPSGFPSGTIKTPEEETTVKCTSGGQTIEMAAVTIDTSNPCGNAANTTGDGSDGDSTNTTSSGGSSGGCSLLNSGSGSGASLLALLGGAIWLLRARAGKGREKV